EVVGEAEDGVQAAERIATLAPDAVLLDIQMPGASGLDVVGSLAGPRPATGLCAAYEQDALDAFELSATDYLLKPINRARLAASLERLRQATAVRDRDRAIDAATRRDGMAPTRFLARRGVRVRVVPRSEVVAFTLDDGVTRLL